MPKAKSKSKKAAPSMEQALWDSANKLRGKVESSEYKHVVLALIFLKLSEWEKKLRLVLFESR